MKLTKQQIKKYLELELIGATVHGIEFDEKNDKDNSVYIKMTKGVGWLISHDEVMEYHIDDIDEDYLKEIDDMIAEEK